MKYFKLSLFLLALMVSLTPNFSSYQIPAVYAQQKENPRKPRIPPVGNALGLLPGPDAKKIEKDEGEGAKYVLNKLLPAATNIFLVLLFLFGTPLLICIGLLFFLNEFNPDLQDKAKEGLFWFGMGTTISILGYSIVRLIIGINFFA